MTKEQLHELAVRNLHGIPANQQLVSRAILEDNAWACLVCGDTEGVGFYYWRTGGMAKLTQLCADCAGIQTEMWGKDDDLVPVIPDDEDDG